MQENASEERPDGAAPEKVAVEATREPPELTPAERLAKVAEAYRAGMISREAYERNMRAFGGTPEPNGTPVVNPLPPPPPPPPPPEPEAGPEAPIANPPAPPTPGPETIAETPAVPVVAVTPPSPSSPTPPSAPEAPTAPTTPAVPEAPLREVFQQRIKVLTSLYAKGRMTQESYEDNLLRAYEDVEPRLGDLRRDCEAGRIDHEAYEANARRLLRERSASSDDDGQ